MTDNSTDDRNVKFNSLADTKLTPEREVCIRDLTNVPSIYRHDPDLLLAAIVDLIRELDRLRQSSGAGRELSAEERDELAEALYISALNCKGATDFLPFAQISEERKEHWRREIGGVLPHISRLLAAAEQKGADECNTQHAAMHETVQKSFAEEKSLAVAGAYEAAANEAQSWTTEFRLRGYGSEICRLAVNIADGIRALTPADGASPKTLLP